MSASIPPIYVEIMADVDKLKAGLKDATDGIKRMDDGMAQTSQGLTGLTTKMKQFALAAGAAFGAQQVMAFAKDAIQASSDFGESLDKVRVVFGDNAAAIEQWSQTASTSMIMTQNEALAAAGTYGNLFRAIGLTGDEAAEMSMTMVQLAADMASFNNANPEDVLLALRGGLAGEAEALKKFGVNVSQAAIELEAMNMGLVQSGEKLTFAQKAQAAYSVIMKQTALQQGNVALTAESTANRQKSLAAQFEDTKRKVGDALMPAYRGLQNILQKYILPAFSTFSDFLIRNQETIKEVANAVVLMIGAFVAYVGIMKVVRAVQVAYLAVQGLMAGATLASMAATNGMAAAMSKLNMAMRANPIGLIVTAVGLLAAGFVMLWNRSETFRKVLVNMAKAGIMAVGWLIENFGNLAQGILAVITGPTQLFLKAMAALGSETAQKGLNMIQSGIKKVGDFFDSAADQVRGYTDKLEGLKNKKIKLPSIFGDTSAKTGDIEIPEIDMSGITKAKDTAKKSAEEIAKAVDKIRDSIKKLRRDVKEVLKDFAADMAELEKDRLKSIAEAQERYAEQVADMQERYAERVANAQERYAEQTAEIQERYDEQVTEAKKRNAKRLADIAKQYAKAVEQAEENLAKRTTELRENAAARADQLRKQAAEREAQLIQQSVNRLRDAFAQGTRFSLMDAFKAAPTADALVENLQRRLEAMRRLQENAAELASMGYSQVFIEEVVKGGPEAGNALAEALKAATPEVTAELQALYSQVGTLSETGLNTLAQTMNEGANLATSELREAYAQVAVDLRESLEQVNVELLEGLAEAQEDYQNALLEAAKVRDEAIAEAQADLAEALAEAEEQRQKALAEAQADLQRALAEAQADLAKSLKEAQQDLAKSLTDIQASYDEAVARIVQRTNERLAELRRQLRQAAQELAQFNAQAARVASQQAARVPTVSAPAVTPVAAASYTNVTNNNVNISNTNTVSGQQVADYVLGAIRLGQTVTTTPMVAV